MTPLPASIATAGIYYAVSPDQTTVAYSMCCDPAGAAPRGERRRDAGTSDLRDRRGRLRRTVVSGRLAARVSATGRLDPAPREPVRPGRGNGPTHADSRTSRHSRGTWWFTFPSFAPDGQSILFQLPRGDPNSPIWDLWSVPVTGGKSDPRPTQRRVGRLLAGRHTARVSLTGQRERLHRRRALDHGRPRGNTPSPGSPTGISSG